MPSLDYSRNQKVYARARVCANTQYHHLPEQKPRYREAFLGPRKERRQREEKAGIPFHWFLPPLSRGPADMMDDAIREEEESLFMEGEREFLSKRAALHCVVCMPFPVWSRHVLLAITYLQRKRGEEEEGGEGEGCYCMYVSHVIYLFTWKVERRPQLRIRIYLLLK